MKSMSPKFNDLYYKSVRSKAQGCSEWNYIETCSLCFPISLTLIWHSFSSCKSASSCHATNSADQGWPGRACPKETSNDPMQVSKKWDVGRKVENKTRSFKCTVEKWWKTGDVSKCLNFIFPHPTLCQGAVWTNGLISRSSRTKIWNLISRTKSTCAAHVHSFNMFQLREYIQYHSIQYIPQGRD